MTPWLDIGDGRQIPDPDTSSAGDEVLAAWYEAARPWLDVETAYLRRQGRGRKSLLRIVERIKAPDGTEVRG